MLILTPDSEKEVAEIVLAGQRVEIMGSGTKLGLGKPVAAERRLDMSRLSGITLYEPDELVMSAKAGTPLAEIEAALAAHKQCLAFEPPDLSGILGTTGGQTIGGIVATGLTGPRRISAGAVRDHVLGLRAVNGRGEVFRAGGRVVKNVTGYDLCKLLTGSYGTMAVFTEITFKVLPAAETELTAAIHGLDAAASVRLMSQALGSSAGISGAVWDPGSGVTSLRLEGFARSVEARRHRLDLLLREQEKVEIWEGEKSRNGWRNAGNAAPLAPGADWAVWKISLSATDSPALIARLRQLGEHRLLLDWGGALLWVTLPCGPDAQASSLRALLPEDAHAMLVAAPAEIRAAQPVFQPRPVAQSAVEERVRQSFDPDRLLNPGRMAC